MYLGQVEDVIFETNLIQFCLGIALLWLVYQDPVFDTCNSVEMLHTGTAGMLADQYPFPSPIFMLFGGGEIQKSYTANGIITFCSGLDHHFVGAVVVELCL